MGKSGWLLLGILVAGISHAETSPPGGFQDLMEFVQALEEMPMDEFSKRASETPLSAIREYHEKLRQLDPRHFERWNEKLRLIPCMGFVRYSGCWELHAPGPNTTIGFRPELKPGGFVSVVDFYESLLNDEVAVFQARVGETSEADFERWMAMLEVRNPDLYMDALLKLQVMRTVGFLPDQEYRMVNPRPSEPGPLGFGAREPASIEPPTAFRSSAEMVLALESLSPEQLRARLQATSPAQRKRLLEALRRRDPEGFMKLLERVRSRTQIGFSRSSRPEVITPPKKGEPRPSVGFRLPEPSCSDLLVEPK